MLESSVDAYPTLQDVSKALIRSGLPYHAFGAGPSVLPGIDAPAWVAAAQPYPLVPPPSEAEPLGSVASFAAVHWYRVLAERLITARRAIMDDLRARGYAARKADFRVLVNSPVPEKPLAAWAGLGLPGRHSLLIHAELGPAFVIGILLLPFIPSLSAAEEGSFERKGPQPVRNPCCSGCVSCIASCPTSAILPEGGIVRERCLQYWAGREDALPEWMLPLWGTLLWGCDRCLRACMESHHWESAHPDHAEAARGLPGSLGNALPLAMILEADDAALRTLLRGSALGLSWIKPAAIKRNAILAAGNRQASSRADCHLIALLERYRKSDHPALFQAVKWSLERLNAGKLPGS